VAHDFNNLLTAIFMQLDVLASRHPVGDPSYEGLNEIKQTSTRAADRPCSIYRNGTGSSGRAAEPCWQKRGQRPARVLERVWVRASEAFLLPVSPALFHRVFPVTDLAAIIKYK